MRAIRVQAFGGPEVLRLEEVPELRAPRDGEVLIRLRASGVNPVETYVRSGQYAGLPSLPYTPGSDGAGIVVAVGGSDTHFNVSSLSTSGRTSTRAKVVWRRFWESNGLMRTSL